MNKNLNVFGLAKRLDGVALTIIRLYNSGMSYSDIGKEVGRAKRSVIRSVASYGEKHHRDKWECLAKRRASGVPFANGARSVTLEIQAAIKEKKEIRKAHLAEHREVARHWAWYENRLKVRYYSTRIFLKMLKTNHGFRCKFYARNRIKNLLRNKGVWSSGGSVSKWVGCTGQDLKLHLESKFRHGMTWDNHGSVWEIDHIIPLASIDLTNTDEVARLSHYTNLQPLTICENRKKADSVGGVRAKRPRQAHVYVIKQFVVPPPAYFVPRVTDEGVV